MSKKDQPINVTFDDFNQILTDTILYQDDDDKVTTIELSGEVPEFNRIFTIILHKGDTGIAWSDIREDKDVPEEAEVLYMIRDEALDYEYPVHTREYERYRPVFQELEQFMFEKVDELRKSEITSN